MATVGLITVALAAMLALPVTAGAQTAEADAELNRVRDLVRAGALPRRKLLDAENDRLARGYRETLNRTLLSDELEPSELPTMLDAARKLQAIAQERFDLALARVEAGVLPARSLEKERDALAAAKRQAELARTRADLVRQRARMVAAESYLEELEGEELAYRFEGFNEYEQEALSEIDEMYYMTFGESPPVSAEGATAMHRAMGLDHTGRIDVVASGCLRGAVPHLSPGRPGHSVHRVPERSAGPGDRAAHPYWPAQRKDRGSGHAPGNLLGWTAALGSPCYDGDLCREATFPS